MKTIITVILFLATSTLFGQPERPRTEFTIDLSESNLTLKPGETKVVTVLLARSKSFSRVKATMSFMSVLPKGISVTFEPQEGDFESTQATIAIAETVAPGVYQLVPSATLSRTKKGSVLKLTVQ